MGMAKSTIIFYADYPLSSFVAAMKKSIIDYSPFLCEKWSDVSV